ncbi:restriction endonuclease subunit S [Pseudomonas huanghezhanensis]|uniref:restriction endonuclease subunit S n=1 Tax=Pseudomonas huanghezhanensis TaxID=3002903 RepID=UPI00228692A2|nr:restriction endonuclease subunit S [Pseudomonas sp. BSw22131]
MVPEKWTNIHLGEIFEFKNGLNTDKASYGHGQKFINVMDVLNNSTITESEIIGRVKVSEKQLEDYSVKKGDILFNRTSETFSEIAMSAVYIGEQTVTFGGFVIRGRPKNPILRTDFLAYVLQSKNFRTEAIKRGQGVVRANIGQKDLATIQVLVPSHLEQKKIAKILSAWDQAIVTSTQLLEASQQQKKVLMRKLLAGKQRLPGFSYQWTSAPVASCLLGSSLRNLDSTLGLENVMSVNKTEGMIPMRERTIGKSINRYKIVKNGWFAYNPMRINVGSICRWNKEENCLVSPDYIVFRCNESVLLGSYFDQFRKSERWTDYMNNAGSGSVRVRIYLKDLSQLEIPLPRIEEQQKIAQFLSTIDCEIETLQKKLACLRQEKKALMHQLLTGTRRVQVDKMETA